MRATRVIKINLFFFAIITVKFFFFACFFSYHCFQYLVSKEFRAGVTRDALTTPVFQDRALLPGHTQLPYCRCSVFPADCIPQLPAKEKDRELPSPHGHVPGYTNGTLLHRGDLQIINVKNFSRIPTIHAFSLAHVRRSLSAS